MNLAQLLNIVAIQSMSDVDIGSHTCRSQSKVLVSCLKSNVGFTESESQQCILCTIAASEDSHTHRKSTATDCGEFESDGFCGNLNQCFREDCSDECKVEYRAWATCTFEEIGCPLLCRRKKVEDVRKIA